MKKWCVWLLLLALLLPVLSCAEGMEPRTQTRSNLTAPGIYGTCADHPQASILLVYTDTWQYLDGNQHLFFSEGTGYCAECGTVVWQGENLVRTDPHAIQDGVCACGFPQPAWLPGQPEDADWYPSEPQGAEVFFSFSGTAHDFGTKLNKPVYTGPGTEYLRANDGKAQFVSSEFRYAGLEGDWMLVRCSVKSGIRYGYINVREYRDQLWSVPALDFAYQDAVITRSTQIWDSMMLSSMGPLGTLYEGTHVTYLGTFLGDEMSLVFVETTLNGRKARGFVSTDCVQLGGGW